MTITVDGADTGVANFSKGQDDKKFDEVFKVLSTSFQAGKLYKIRIDYSNTVKDGPEDFDGMTLFAYNGGGRTQEVNLIISRGQDGYAVPDDDEETIGSFTVANLNNTDSDATVDNSDNNVPGEKDLMKLEISRPAGAATDKVTVKVTSGSARLWQSASKGTAVPLVNGAAEFTVGSLPKTIYLEATTTSPSLRSISVELDSKGNKDTVKATGVWANMVAAEHDKRSFSDVINDPIWKDLPDDPKRLLQLIGGTGLQPVSGVGVHNVILIKFSVLPVGVGKEEKVKFDVSRQASARVWEKNSLEEPWKEIVKPPVPQVFPTVDDEANDDPAGEGDEGDGADSNGYLYVIDGPGSDGPTATSELLNFQSSFREFVRVSFDGVRPSGTSSGSRCANKYTWHCRHYLENGKITGRWRRISGDDTENTQNDVAPGEITIGVNP